MTVSCAHNSTTTTPLSTTPTPPHHHGEEEQPEPGMKAFFQSKFKREAQRNWDIFYHHNTVNFFKDRHWTGREFEELLPSPASIQPSPSKTLLEIGCGVGNFLFPLLKDNPQLYIHACDFSAHAIALLHASPSHDPARVNAFVADVTFQELCPHDTPSISETNNQQLNESPQVNDPALTPTSLAPIPASSRIPRDSVDIVAAIFVLSAIPPEKMPFVIANIKKTMRPGAVFIFRDYGVGDAAQLRFKPTSLVSPNLYVRGDGTLSYFFSKEFLTELFEGAGGFECLENDYFRRQIVNRKKELTMNRVWLQAKFRLK